MSDRCFLILLLGSQRPGGISPGIRRIHKSIAGREGETRENLSVDRLNVSLVFNRGAFRITRRKENWKFAPSIENESNESHVVLLSVCPFRCYVTLLRLSIYEPVRTRLWFYP